MGLRGITVDLNQLVDETIVLNEIPAPTFDERQKAEYVKKRFEQIGLEVVRLDRVGNVLGYIFGQEPSQEVVLAAHIDTVFPHGTKLTVVRKNGSLIGPGIGDNNLAVASLLAVAEHFKKRGEKPRRTLVFAATVGEEGLGDLYGVRAMLKDYQDEGRNPAALVAIEGHGLGNVCHQGVGSRRMRVTVNGPGGHSWDKAGRPSAIHGLAEIMSQMTRVAIPNTPKTSFNIGTIEGGISVNTIAPEAKMVFEVRSLEEGALAETFDQMVRIINKYEAEGLTVETELVGNRPAGGIPANTPIVDLCSQIYRELRIEPSYIPFSTDANIALSMGLPAICVGISRGGNAHRTDEWIEIAPAATGVQALAGIAAGLAF